MVRDKHPRWRGGRSDLNVLIRNSKRYKNWAKDIRDRDKYKCQFCESKKIIQVDHITPMCTIINNLLSNRSLIDKYDKLEFLLKCDELFDINNGRVLCINCHRKITNKQLSEGAFVR